MKNSLSVEDLLSDMALSLKLEYIVCGQDSLKKTITVPDLNRPGLAFADYYDYFDSARIQIIGKTEISFLSQLSQQEREKRIKKLISCKIPLVMFSHGVPVCSLFKKEAEKYNIAIVSTPITTTRVIGSLTLYLEEKFAPSQNFHATLMDVHGIGVLLLGKSGVGKSECALELVERGHRLVADDFVLVTKKMGRYLLGSSNGLIQHHMEIRGLGIIDILSTYGVGAVRKQKQIGVVVSLEEWKNDTEYERLGLDEKLYSILGISLPHFVIPVKSGRNIAILIEVAVSTQRLKNMGINPAQKIEDKIINKMKED